MLHKFRKLKTYISWCKVAYKCCRHSYDRHTEIFNFGKWLSRFDLCREVLANWALRKYSVKFHFLPDRVRKECRLKLHVSYQMIFEKKKKKSVKFTFSCLKKKNFKNPRLIDERCLKKTLTKSSFSWSLLSPWKLFFKNPCFLGHINLENYLLNNPRPWKEFFKNPRFLSLIMLKKYSLKKILVFLIRPSLKSALKNPRFFGQIVLEKDFSNISVFLMILTLKKIVKYPTFLVRSSWKIILQKVSFLWSDKKSLFKSSLKNILQKSSFSWLDLPWDVFFKYPRFLGQFVLEKNS